ncbi:uncharacterized protein N7518_002761 [Penicillium psychrosexuale]|uniref:uncharacterized protein n=1 Tax=Penicillium psychrosexuale TaxID=1002107 RepID=UPI002545B9D8|nr:uncharacterized protein N7518_002761 [Penicillium psychrosexuale]KAJ5800693.1 hypothetical protein N7518_002761 [Penicillium psychrosexuale]
MSSRLPWALINRANVGFVLPGPNGSTNSRLTTSVEFVAIYRLLTRLRPPDLFVYDEARLAECSN